MSANAALSVRSRFTPLHYAALIALAVLVLYAPTFWSMVLTWSRDATFAHGFAIPAISLWLLWQRRERLISAPLAPAPVGVWLCLALALVWLTADLLAVQVARQAAATALLPAALWAVLGTEFVRRAFFPLAYLAFAVPFGDVFVPILMRFTTEFTVIAVRLTGVPIFQEGNSFSLPSGNFEVIKACSGVRYLIAAVALGTLYAGITYHDWQRRLAFVALSIVVPIIANGLRAFGIVMIAHSSQMQLAVGVDHLIYGWLFFGLVMLLLFWIGSRLPEPAAAERPSAVKAVDDARLRSPAWLTATLLGAVLLAGPAAATWVRSAAQQPGAGAAARLPPASATWRGPSPLANEWQAAFAQDATAVSARYNSMQGSVLLFVRDYAGELEAENALTATALVAQEQGPWRVAPGPDVDISGRGTSSATKPVQVRSAHITGNDGSQLQVWVWYLVNGQLTSGPIRAKWLQLRSWLELQQPVSSIVAVATPGVQGHQARGVLMSFLDQYPALLGITGSAASGG
jgi:exosortase A